VDPENNFAMIYELNEGSEKAVKEIISTARKADAVYLATDLDREGEAISWHIYEILREAGLTDKAPFYRVEFSEITKSAIQDAVDNPRKLSMPLVNAQQARRALDHLVGFNLSPLLWKKIQTGLSAGRVQSPALRMIVEREREIEAFEAQEYWSIEADLKRGEEAFLARLVVFEGDKLKQFDIPNGERANAIRKSLLEAASGTLKVDRINRSQRKRSPAPPFMTSTLQQDAARKLGFTANRTMRVAQQLYEQGLITYMRTDSLTVSKQALEELRKVIGDRYGSEYVPEKPNFYRSKSKNAQEAHEAIRPTSAALTPKDAKSQLKEEQAKLYDMIWKRTMACQMSQALVDTVAIEFDCGEGVFRANGSVVTFPGFLKVYQAPVPKGQEEQDTALPDLQEGETVAVDAIRAEQHFTEPPPRYSEASLVKALEDYGIGRPSTYASIIQTLQRRGYVEMDRRRFIPTDTGRVVARFLENHFEPYVDYEFTARMEDELDAISRGEVDWIPPLERFWKPFIKRVREKEDSVSRQEAKLTRELGTDPKTGKPVSVRLGKYGPHAQIGSIDDEDKPRFAGLGQGQRLETITLEEALELFKLPRELGFTPEGEPVSAAVGRYGPYIRYGNKFVSLKDADPRTVALSQALELIADKKKADLEKIIRGWPDSDVQILKGRWGPYIADGKKNARIPKDLEPDTLTLEQCQELLAAAPDRKGRGKKKAARKKAPKKAPKKATKKTAGKKATAKKTPASKKKASRKRKASAA